MMYFSLILKMTAASCAMVGMLGLGVLGVERWREGASCDFS